MTTHQLPPARRRAVSVDWSSVTPQTFVRRLIVAYALLQSAEREGVAAWAGEVFEHARDLGIVQPASPRLLWFGVKTWPGSVAHAHILIASKAAATTPSRPVADDWKLTGRIVRCPPHGGTTTTTINAELDTTSLRKLVTTNPRRLYQAAFDAVQEVANEINRVAESVLDAAEAPAAVAASR